MGDWDSLPVAPGERLLVVDDSVAVGRLVQTTFADPTGTPVDHALSLADCRRLLAQHSGVYPVAVVDLNLPDAPDGEAVDLVLSHGVAAVVLTAAADEALHARISAKPIVDYVVKKNPGSIETVYRDVRRVLRNRGRKVLLVGDSAAFLRRTRQLMETQRLQILEAGDGPAALRTLERNPDVALVATDYELPAMDGIALTAALRARFPAAAMAIIGLWETEDTFVGVRFLKAGASDIVRRPFLVEEFLGRVNNCLDQLDNIRMIQEQANRDYLTRLHNRRYLFEAGSLLFSSTRRGHIRLTAAIIDIDHFKRINDSFGHDAGDLAIKTVASLLSGAFRATDIVARIGGEEFCVLATNAEPPEEMFERLRQRIAALEIALGQEGPARLTVSIGVACGAGAGSLDDLIKAADRALYEAKQGGRNRVVVKTSID